MDIENFKHWHIKLPKTDEEFIRQTKHLADNRHQSVAGMVMSLIEQEMEAQRDVGKFKP